VLRPGIVLLLNGVSMKKRIMDASLFGDPEPDPSPAVEPEAAEPSSSAFPPGKDEMNFAEFPIALLTDRVPKGQKSIEFVDSIYDEKRKKMIIRRRIIEGSEQYGLPTATDDAVILALIQLTKLRGDFQRREVVFTRSELLEMLGWPREGKNYDRLKLSLLRIANVTYNYDNAWWDARQKTWTTRAFHIIDIVEINDSRASSELDASSWSRIVWGGAVFESFRWGFLRDIDFRLCMRLEHAISLRMYRFLGKRFHHKPDWTFDLKEFANDHLCLGRNYEGGSQIARKLQPAIAELELAGFLEPLPEAERFPRDGRTWRIRLRQRERDVAALPAPEEASGPGEAGDGVVEAGPAAGLVARGVHPEAAAQLARDFPAGAIGVQVEVFDWLMLRRDKKVGRNPAGYLVKAIREGYAPPARGFTGRADLRRRDDAERAGRLAASEASRLRREEGLREEGLGRAVAAHWEGLDPDGRAGLEAAALAQAGPEMLAMLKGPLKGPGLRMIREEHIRRLIEAAGPETPDA
jgi:hypothetical protein